MSIGRADEVILPIPITMGPELSPGTPVKTPVTRAYGCTVKYL